MAPVMQPRQNWNGSFRADLLELRLGEITTGMLAQSINFNYTQQVTMLFEVGSTNVYYVAGHAQGQAQLQRVLGPGASVATFMSAYGNVCAPKNIDFSAKGGCKSGQPNAAGGTQGNPDTLSQKVEYTLEYAVLTTVGTSVDSQSIVVQENFGLMFANLDVKDGKSVPASAAG